VKDPLSLDQFGMQESISRFYVDRISSMFFLLKPSSAKLNFGKIKRLQSVILSSPKEIQFF